MEKVKPPISSLFDLSTNSYETNISVRRLKLDRPDHFKKAKNLICWAIIYSKGTVAKINVDYDQNQSNIEALLRLVNQQKIYFNIDISVPSYKEDYEFKDTWYKGINESIRTDVSSMDNWLYKAGVSNQSDFQYYQTVTNNKTQIRFRGYQVGRWNIKRGQFDPVNNTSGSNFTNWVDYLRKERSKIGTKLFMDKAEHYMESVILKLMSAQSFTINKNSITNVFSNSKVNFQFPALLYGSEYKNNNPKYIDILGKTEDNRPVLMELKVFSKNGTSRGEYLFEAISQVICYYNFYRQLKVSNDKNLKLLPELFNLEWDRPILAVIVNNIGSDKTAKEFREYMNMISRKFNKNITFEFIELDSIYWDRREVKII